MPDLKFFSWPPPIISGKILFLTLINKAPIAGTGREAEAREGDQRVAEARHGPVADRARRH